MSKTSVQIATDDAHRAFDEGNDHVDSDSFMVATIVARPSLGADSLSLGVCLCDELGTRQKAIIFKKIAEQLAAAAVEEDLSIVSFEGNHPRSKENVLR